MVWALIHLMLIRSAGVEKKRKMDFSARTRLLVLVSEPETLSVWQAPYMAWCPATWITGFLVLASKPGSFMRTSRQKSSGKEKRISKL